MTAFLPGRDLSRRFDEEAVRPLLFIIQSTHDTARGGVAPRHLPVVE
jgi:hypothetical protein